MSKYVFILRKNNIEIELSATDPEFIARQLKIWQESMAPGLTTKSAAPHKITGPQLQPEIYHKPIPETANIPQVMPIETTVEEEQVISELDQTLAEAKSVVKEMQEALEIAEEIPRSDVRARFSENIHTQASAEIQHKETAPPAGEIGSHDNLLDSFAMPDEVITQPADETDNYDNLIDSFAIPDEVIDKQPDEIDSTDNLLDSFVIPDEVVEQQTDEIGDYDNLLDSFVTPEEGSDVRVTEGAETEQADVLSEEMSNISELLAQFDAESEQESMVVEATDYETTLVSEFISDEPEIAQKGAEEDEFDALISAMEEEIKEEEQPNPVEQIKQEIKEKQELQPVTYEAFIQPLPLKTPIDLLLSTAYYMEHHKSSSKFTTKDISNLTLSYFKKPMSPNIILATVNKGYIEVVPDFTGTAESNEYALTDLGRAYLLKELL